MLTKEAIDDIRKMACPGPARDDEGKCRAALDSLLWHIDELQEELERANEAERVKDFKVKSQLDFVDRQLKMAEQKVVDGPEILLARIRSATEISTLECDDELLRQAAATFLAQQFEVAPTPDPT